MQRSHQTNKYVQLTESKQYLSVYITTVDYFILHKVAQVL